MLIKYKKYISFFVFFLVGVLLFILLPTPVSATETIDITAPNLLTWNLSPETTVNSTIGQLFITTTEADGRTWQVTAADLDTVNTNGFLTKYSSGYDTGTKLTNPLQVVGPDGIANLPSEGVVIQGADTVSNAQYNIDFQQQVPWTDPVANYQIVVTFMASFTN